MAAAIEVDLDSPSGATAALRSTRAVRQRAGLLTERARADGSRWFTVHDDALDSAAELVADVTRHHYPDLQVPFHSRWRHFEAGGVDRRAELLSGADATALVDLTVVSVLLDAGAGPSWSYAEPGTGLQLSRSEGLGVASFHAFASGLFSSDPGDPLRVDAAALAELTEQQLADAFQVDDTNPLVGLDGRVAILHRLGAVTAADPEVFGPEGRPGGLVDAVGGSSARASELLSTVLNSLAPIWPGGSRIGDQPLGDCWRHSALAGPGLTAGWMPFHKLSQWLTYSLLEPFGWAGITVTDLDELTGLPEYRNGGLLLDTGVLRLRDRADSARSVSVTDELVVEWRALTVTLLDELAPLVRRRLGVDADQMPLARVLEGGTWAAGRALARRLRGGLPPLSIVSDGTVF
ncbi:uracil phosphoribosyltransferase [Mycolicibacterium aromaticivorans JS19b1 = JCM 16368]|uniref:Uracil phosphoribosyltransferase n=1 Tax=Mycolicibacterium aromaticivorans JS19b1 = JCM 16368 TaxID=1440774 RepID=A0A064CK26_9MYCO|nr:URC4/urg3 family protein [Mycolicibacterium aromaticivorans]KDF00022.1 uracil phosphoribosyltransferase [Mycolicibacterium aromaticivorans JS19b1 = JCM 16368]